MTKSLTAEQEKIVNTLTDTEELMTKSKVNLKKCPKSRLTKGYIQSRIQCVEEYWKVFTSSHQQLTMITPRDKRNVVPYFENDVYSETEDLDLSFAG
ncbi:unnamed protein product [Arctia plantaginis]|uniref:Uncharacterized protein n=1 Tax=Arctia plantaginis TaxID=874455 RepID=A0A8S1AP57_ARCPL|nr:unnamed protein product [Arctia plantaginis]